MRPVTLVSVMSALAVAGVEAQSNATGTVTGSLGDATVVTNNPIGPVYTAVLPTTEFYNPADSHGNVKGGISATAGPGGVGVAFTIKFSNLPTSRGPFLYHLHVMPVDSTGNCNNTGAHIDPFLRGESPACDSTNPQTCQVGDLSGKHGKITTDPFTASYVDPYASILPGSGSFFGNRSFVIHFSDKQRITCANFSLVSGTATSNVTSTATASATPATFTGSAVSVTASLLTVFGALTAALFL